MHVYLITNLINDKKYVGAEKNGNNPEYYGSSWEISKIRKRLGEEKFKENFSKEILIDNISSQEELNEIESYFIIGLDTIAPNGYNKKIYAWPPPVEAQSRGGEIGAETNRRQGTGLYDPANRGDPVKAGKKGAKIGAKIGGKMSAHVLFEIDGILQMTTLGRILNWM